MHKDNHFGRGHFGERMFMHMAGKFGRGAAALARSAMAVAVADVVARATCFAPAACWPTAISS